MGMKNELSAADGQLLAQKSGDAAHITINNPSRRNALSLAMWQAFPGLVDRILTDWRINVMVLAGQGEHFAAGADIAEFAETRADPERARAYEQSNADAFAALRQAPVPTIAAIRGFAMGGGAALALACDLRIAQDDAIIAIPAARLGVGYPIDSLIDLVGIVGAAHARDMMFTGRRLDAEEAKRLGLFNKVVAATAFDQCIRETTAMLADNAPLTIQAAKRTIGAIVANRFEQDRGDLEAATDRCFASDDYREGYQAFLQKRPPVFKGR